METIVNVDLMDYPILFINSPATSKSKVELPGDPVSILYATRLLFDSLNKGYLNSKLRPRIIQHNGMKVYDPRIWNSQTQNQFKNMLLIENPLVVFFCTYSPTHPFALDMARLIKSQNPETLIIFGGKHQDETLNYSPISNSYKIESCNSLSLVHQNKIPPLVDIVISGEGEYLIKFIVEKLGQYLFIRKNFNLKDFLKYISKHQDVVEKLPGNSVIGMIIDGKINLFHTSCQPTSLFDFCSPYTFFPIKTRNPIFNNKKTANIITYRGCKNSCIYCSESILLAQRNPKNINRVERTLERVIENINLGAEAAFFDDSIFFNGDLGKIQEFSNRLIKEKKDAEKIFLERNVQPLDIKKNDFLRRLIDFEYAVQFCVEDVIKEKDKEYVSKVLNDLRESGCSYVYIGIESLDDKVMQNVQKFRKKENREIYNSWFQKVDSALDLFNESKIRIGASLLFGIPGETYKTINTTIKRTKIFINKRKLFLISPNLCTYHPGTLLTQKDKMISKLDYITIPKENDSLMSFFEEASPKHLSKVLNRKMIEYIREQIQVNIPNLNSNTIEDTLKNE